MVLMSTGSVGEGRVGWGVHQSILISRDGTRKENHSLYRLVLNTLGKCIHLDVLPRQQVESGGENDNIHSPHLLTAWPA